MCVKLNARTARSARRAARNLSIDEKRPTLMPKMSSPRGEELADVFWGHDAALTQMGCPDPDRPYTLSAISLSNRLFPPLAKVVANEAASLRRERNAEAKVDSPLRRLYLRCVDICLLGLVTALRALIRSFLSRIAIIIRSA